MPPVGGHAHARSLSPNGARDPLAGAGDHARVLFAPHMKAIARGAERQRRRRRPLGHAYRGGGTVHPVEGALGPDRIPAAAHALGVLGVEPTAGVADPLREQHRAGRRQLRSNRFSGRSHASGRPSLATYSTRPRSHAVMWTVSPKWLASRRAVGVIVSRYPLVASVVRASPNVRHPSR
jgi:hypothetical protein